MTAIQIKYLEALENMRKNRANERLTEQQIAVTKNQLAETIANNLRNYKVNVTKNEIQKLYNDQMDIRERNKLAETIRSNLAKENRELISVFEENRHNLKSEEAKEKDQEISTNKMLIEALTSGGGSTLRGQLISWLRGLVSADIVTSGSVSASTWKWITDIANTVQDLNDKAQAQASEPASSGEQFSRRQPLPRNYPSRIRVGRQIEENEIPTDTSSTVGPGMSTADSRIPKTSNIIIAPSNTGRGPGESSYTAGSTSSSSQTQPKGPERTGPVRSADSRIPTSSAVIYSPRSNVGPGW